MSTCTSKINVVRLIHEERRLAVVEISSVCMRLGLMLLGFRYLVFTGYMGLSIIWLFTRFPERALIFPKGFYTLLSKDFEKGSLLGFKMRYWFQRWWLGFLFEYFQLGARWDVRGAAKAEEYCIFSCSVWYYWFYSSWRGKHVSTTFFLQFSSGRYIWEWRKSFGVSFSPRCKPVI